MRYRRARAAGASHFFTVVTWRRRPILTRPRVRSLLGDALRSVQRHRPFQVDAIVLLPDHLHCVWTLPPEDTDFSTRWRLVKRRVTARASCRPVWQARFWEHLIRNDRDYRAHLDYIHYNPVHHGFVDRPCDWPWSSFHRLQGAGVYPADWGSTPPAIPDWAGRE